MGTQLLRAPKLVLTDAERARLDESPDANFYSTPRLMQHADDAWLEALTGIYARILPPGAAVLELCASAHSHLPQGSLQPPRLMVGQGMNSREMAANPSLHQHFLQDLNLQPLLLEQLDASYDVVLCVNGIQYLTQMETVVAEASRVLRPGGMLVVAFGPDCFREKALAGWLSRSTQERTALLQAVIAANGFDTPAVLDSPAAADSIVRSRAAQAAPPPAAAASPASAAAAQRLSQQPATPLPQPAAPPAAPSVAPSGPQAPPAVQQNDASTGPSSSSSSSGGAGGQDLQLQVLVAVKSSDWTAGAAEADTAAAVDMQPDNVQAWFTKPGLAGLAEAAASHNAPGTAADQRSTRASNPSDPNSSGSSVPGPQPTARLAGGPAEQKLLQQWHAAYASLVTDAVDLGIPRSVIPTPSPDASPAELQAAVQHLQDMMASFLSAGL